jgi:hypothetical protein
MDAHFRTVVTFTSKAFNVSKPKDYFINECCFGDDVATWLVGELRKQFLEVDEKPGQEDFGWYLGFRVADISYFFVITYRPDNLSEGQTWIAWVELNRGFPGYLFGGRKRGVQLSALEAIHKVLSAATQVRDVRWHLQSDFEKGLEDRGAPSPS